MITAVQKLETALYFLSALICQKGTRVYGKINSESKEWRLFTTLSQAMAQFHILNSCEISGTNMNVSIIVFE